MAPMEWRMTTSSVMRSRQPRRRSRRHTSWSTWSMKSSVRKPPTSSSASTRHRAPEVIRNRASPKGADWRSPPVSASTTVGPSIATRCSESSGVEANVGRKSGPTTLSWSKVRIHSRLRKWAWPFDSPPATPALHSRRRTSAPREAQLRRMSVPDVEALSTMTTGAWGHKTEHRSASFLPGLWATTTTPTSRTALIPEMESAMASLDEAALSQLVQRVVPRRTGGAGRGPRGSDEVSDGVAARPPWLRCAHGCQPGQIGTRVLDIPSPLHAHVLDLDIGTRRARDRGLGQLVQGCPDTGARIEDQGRAHERGILDRPC